MMLDFRCIADLRADLLESPVWDERRGLLFFCDIPGRRVHACDLERGVQESWDFEAEVVSLGLCGSGRLVVALARKVILFDPESGERQDLWAGYTEPSTSRLNDGKVGPDGAFYVGSMDSRPEREAIGQLYRVDAAGSATVVAKGVAVSNGLAWSPDGTTMYHSDSGGAWIDRYSFDPARGTASERQRLIDLDETTGRPDGGACDADGNYWSAGVSAGLLNRISPQGEVLDRYRTPVPAPTMPCFCGPDLDQLAVTSHRLVSEQALHEAPQSGGLFLVRSPVRGAPVARMKGL